MYFNSYIFVLLFLPIVLCGYYIINWLKKYRLGQMWLVVASMFFIGYFNIQYSLITLLCIVLGYLFIFLVTNEKYSAVLKKTGLISGIVFHISVLFLFKYYNFFVENINQFMGKRILLLDILLPIGISFYTFQQVAYLVDCYRNPSLKCDFLEYMLCISFFPKFLQGPILLQEDILPQIRDEQNKRFSPEALSRGLYAFALGLGKKVLLADNIAYLVNMGYSNIEYLNSPSAFLVMVSYSLQLYFDFSGYCDMAVGIGEMFQIRMPINFDSPYKATSITDIWARWHTTLTRFFTRYVYIPLGGNRKGMFRMYFNTFFVFLLSGLWHGAAWTYILWGLIHAVGMVCSKYIKQSKIIIPKVIGWGGTFLFWVASFAIFRASTIKQAGDLFYQLFHGGMGRISSVLFEALENHIEIRILQRVDFAGILKAFPEIVVILLVMLPLMGCLFMKNTQEKLENFKFTYYKLFVTILLIFISIISFGGMNEFLYINF